MTDIHELFQRDPLELSEQDLDAIIRKFRESRGQFALGNAMAGSTKKPSEKTQKTLDLAAKLNLDLDNL